MTPRAPAAALPLLLTALLATPARPAVAVDIDVGLSIRARETLAAGCMPADSADDAGADAPQAWYAHGLCLLYGPHARGRDADRGVATLRRAAGGDLVEAQVALGDYFQAASPARLQDALYWYGRAQTLGDARAGMRAARVRQRIVLEAATPTPPPDTIVDPSPVELESLYRAGYHCHAVLREQWCHIADDL